MAKEQKYPIPNMENATPQLCIDQIAENRELQKRGKFYEGFHRKILDARWPEVSKTGMSTDNFKATYTPTVTERISPDAVRSFFDKWGAQFEILFPDENNRPNINEVLVVSGGFRLNIDPIEK
jgi:hypothetical protein